jgi:hypothetical protein
VNIVSQLAADGRIPVEGGTANRVLDFSNPWPSQETVYRDEAHYRAAEAALERFEATGDFRHGLSALVHSILAINVADAGANYH